MLKILIVSESRTEILYNFLRGNYSLEVPNILCPCNKEKTSSKKVGV